jgi:HEAT repeat protein
MKDAGRPALPDLRQLIPRVHGYAQVAIVKTMVAVGADPAEVTPILIPMLTERNGDRSLSAGALLIQISPEEARRQVALFIPQLTKDDGSVDSTALSVIHSLGPEAGEAVPALINVLARQDRSMASTAVNTLGRIGAAAEPALPELTAILRTGDLDDSLTHEVVRALARIGPAAKDAVPAILAVIDSAEKTTPAVKQPFYDWKKEQRLSTRVEAISTLADLGPATPEALRTLQSQLASDLERVRGAAARSLARLAGDSPAVLDQVVKLLDDDSAQVRAQAALAIGNMALDRRSVVPRLAALLSDDNPSVRAATAMALKMIGPDAKAALPALRTVLADEMVKRTPSSFVLIADLGRISIAEAVGSAIDAIDSGH